MLSPRTFCGGYANGTGMCTGDAGSGLAVVHENRHYLRGIVSASLLNAYAKCDHTKHSIFTNILSFYGWITDRSDFPNFQQNLNVIGSTVTQKWTLPEVSNHTKLKN